MFNTNHSTQIIQSKLALVLILVVFVTQLFPTCVASDIHINDHVDKDIVGSERVTSAKDSSKLADSILADLALAELGSASSDQSPESCCHNPGHSCAHTRSASEQDSHDDDFHTSCHPPMELHFVTVVNRTPDAITFSVHYQNRSDAPPIPPPYG